MIKVLVSACLLGSPVRHDGRDKFCDHPVLRRWIEEGRIVSACPEVLGGLSTPRPPAEIVADGSRRVLTREGKNVTGAFERGAREAGTIAEEAAVRVAILKENSPSCGSSFIYDGTFSGSRLAGEGITAAHLRKQGIAVFSEEQLDAAAAYIETQENNLSS